MSALCDQYWYWSFHGQIDSSSGGTCRSILSCIGFTRVCTNPFCVYLWTHSWDYKETWNRELILISNSRCPSSLLIEERCNQTWRRLEEAKEEEDVESMSRRYLLLIHVLKSKQQMLQVDKLIVSDQMMGVSQIKLYIIISKWNHEWTVKQECCACI